MRTLLLSLVLVPALLFTSCAKAPPELSPTGKADFYKTRVVKALDELRDTAIAAEANKPQLLSTADTRIVVEAHQSILRTIQASEDASWNLTAQAAVKEARDRLTAAGKTQLAPYFALALTLLQEVPK